MTKHDKDRLLTDTELEFMRVIWDRGSATVNARARAAMNRAPRNLPSTSSWGFVGRVARSS